MGLGGGRGGISGAGGVNGRRDTGEVDTERGDVPLVCGGSIARGGMRCIGQGMNLTSLPEACL